MHGFLNDKLPTNNQNTKENQLLHIINLNGPSNNNLRNDKNQIKYSKEANMLKYARPITQVDQTSGLGSDKEYNNEFVSTYDNRQQPI